MLFISGVLFGFSVYFASRMLVILYRKQAAFAVLSGVSLDFFSRVKGIYIYFRDKIKAFNTVIIKGKQRYINISEDINRIDEKRKITAAEFLAYEEACFVACFLAGLLIFDGYIFALVLGAAGFFVPAAVLKARLERKAEIIRGEIPDCMDLICTGIEGGLSLNAAVSRCAGKGRGLLNAEISSALAGTELGMTFSETLIALKKKLNFSEAEAFIDSIIRAEKSGGNVREIMRARAADLRKKRFQEMKKKAQQAPVKLLVPLIIFIFPVIFMILFGPVIIRLVQGF